MKLTHLLTLASSTLLLTTLGCKKAQQRMTDENTEKGTGTEKIYIDPVPGGSGSIVANTETTQSYIGTNFDNISKNLGGALAGTQMLVSNVPEKVNSKGWVFRGSVNDGTLGSLRGISGGFTFYLYHYLTGTVSTTDNVKGYLVARNVGSSPVTVSGRGYYEVKLNTTDVSASYRTALNWLNDKRSGATQPGTTRNNIQRLRTVSQSIAANSFAILDEVSAPLSQTIDARYELNASGNIVVYYVYENLDALATADKLSRLSTIVGSNTSRAKGVWVDPTPTGGTSPGYIIETGSPAPNVPSGLKIPTANNRFGRECGIYNNSGWSGVTNVSLPSNAAALRLHFNTSAKGGLQEQCAEAGTVNGFRTTTPVDASAFAGTSYNDYDLFLQQTGRPTNATRTYANYGHYYQLTFNITNTTGRTRRVQLLAGRSGGGRYYVPFWVQSAGFVTGNVNQINSVILDPDLGPSGSGTERPIADVTIGNAAPAANIKVNVVIPGSINIGQFFLIKTLD